MENTKKQPTIKTNCDIAIIGSGPSGMSAGLYSARMGFNVIIFEKGAIGGQMSVTPHIENYPGVQGPINGMELAETMKKQAESFGATIVEKHVVKIKNDLVKKTLTFSNGTKITCKAIIIASGAKSRKLNAKGENKFFGRGVSYCAVCDGGFFRNKIVAVIGGGSSALTEAIFLTDICSKVYLIHRRNKFRAEKVLVNQAQNNSKIKIILDSKLQEIKGDGLVNSIIVKNLKTNNLITKKVNGVFIYVGTVPSNEILQDTNVILDEAGYIKTDENMQTNVKGIFASGDIRGKTKQITTATADGTMAALNAAKYIKKI